MLQRIIILLLIIWWKVPLSAQEKIAFDLKNQPVVEVLNQIEKQSGYTFSYNPALLKNFHPVSLQVKDETLEKVLQLLFDKTDIQAIIQDKYIILKKKPKKVTISGFVYDRESHESLIAANVYDRISGQGAVSNQFGFYSLTVPPGETGLRPSYVGYTSEEHRFTITQDTVVHFFLQPSSLLKEVVVDGNLKDQLQQAETGKISFNPSTLKAIPAFLGENDVIKALQQMPGVAVGADGLAGLYVRGGNADENLYLVDGNPLYHIHHLLGLFSTFNPEAVKTMDFYKGSFPARYGGRLSSVVDIRMNDGDMKKYSGSASIGLISSHLNLQGPIVKDRTSFSVSLRRTYLDLLARPTLYYINRKNEKKNPNSHSKINLSYYFYDFNAKINHKLSDKSRIYLSLYDGKDKLYFNNMEKFGGLSYYFDSEGKQYILSESDNSISTANMDIGWGSRMASMNWTYAINSKLFSNATFVYSSYRSNISISNEDYATVSLEDAKTGEETSRTIYSFYNPKFKSGIEDMGYRLDFDYAYDNHHLVRFGTALLRHNFHPEENRIYQIEEDGERNMNDTITFASGKINVEELSFYAEDEMDFGKRLKINAGVHLSGFFVQGKSYLSAQPRLSVRYLLSNVYSLKASYGKMNQYVHLLQSSYINTPNDLWVPVTKNVKPLSSHQFSGGIFGRYRKIDLSAEAYFKKSTNQVEYKDDASLFASNANWEERIAQGIGTSYGVELMAKRSFGKTSGWAGYTLSWANRRFPEGEINQGKVYPARYDNRHKINVVLLHQFNTKFDMNISWIYATGNWTTLPVEEYIDMDGNKRLYVHQRNNYKMPDYHRLDLGFNYYRQKKKGRMGIWNLSIYNAYAHHNSFIIEPMEKKHTLRNNLNEYSVIKMPAYQSIAMFPFIPSFSYTYKF